MVLGMSPPLPPRPRGAVIADVIRVWKFTKASPFITTRARDLPRVITEGTPRERHQMKPRCQAGQDLGTELGENPQGFGDAAPGDSHGDEPKAPAPHRKPFFPFPTEQATTLPACHPLTLPWPYRNKRPQFLLAPAKGNSGPSPARGGRGARRRVRQG